MKLFLWSVKSIYGLHVYVVNLLNLFWYAEKYFLELFSKLLRNSWMSFCKETCYKQVSIKISKIKHITNYLKPENRNIRKTGVQGVIRFLSVCPSVWLSVSLCNFTQPLSINQSINQHLQRGSWLYQPVCPLCWSSVSPFPPLGHCPSSTADFWRGQTPQRSVGCASHPVLSRGHHQWTNPLDRVAFGKSRLLSQNCLELNLNKCNWCW